MMAATIPAIVTNNEDALDRDMSVDMPENVLSSTSWQRTLSPANLLAMSLYTAIFASGEVNPNAITMGYSFSGVSSGSKVNSVRSGHSIGKSASLILSVCMENADLGLFGYV
jgi:hypothetical protein